ncbi:hypothetical protein FR932_13050 [Moritella marina ATCC 15381]|uniref:Hpt domain-containing protein n=2 Tax=Moritella marina TaxID=90736 RepID=A0A5J6WQA4_MORMI|nr:hypothetical protein FR932_13050 [Moritella marina ATCC 15381]
MTTSADFMDIGTDLKRFFNRYSEQRRLALYQALMRELVSMRAQSKDAKSVDEMNTLKHQFKGICRYLVLDFDAPIDAIQTREKLFCAVDSIYTQVVAIKDEL